MEILHTLVVEILIRPNKVILHHRFRSPNQQRKKTVK